MKQKMVKLWNWKGIDYLIQIAGIIIFATAFFHFQGANQTLEEKGCSVYWEQYKDVNTSEVVLLNSSEREQLTKREEVELEKYKGNKSLNFTG